jgi:hypothetical protein
LAFGETAGGFDVENVCALLAEGESAAEYAEFGLYDLENFVEELGDVVLSG